MSCTAIVDIEYPSKLSPPLAYPVRYDVAMARPDRLRISGRRSVERHAARSHVNHTRDHH
jgi:hypothetical protein